MASSAAAMAAPRAAPACPAKAAQFAGRAGALRRASAAPVRRTQGAVTVRAVSTAGAPSAAPLGGLIAEIASVPDANDRLKKLIEMSAQLNQLPDADKGLSNRVMGCTSQSWIDVKLAADGKTLSLRGDSDAQITKGFCALLCAGLDGLTPEQLLEVDDSIVSELQIGPALLPKSRSNGFRNMLETAKKQARQIASGQTSDPFPSLLITADELSSQGAFAEAQAEYLEPNEAAVDALVKVLEEKKIGIVAHFYMDPEVQGVLMAAKQRYPHVYISDSLVMADTAVKMVNEGCTSVGVLGVDFMSENVRAILDDAGHNDVPVYRMAAEDIGCSLAEAAQSDLYTTYLAGASEVSNAVHIIYINTGLDTKATANALVPTITCTSSNVVATVLQAAAQISDVNIFYGPDTYMGGNLAELFTQMSQWSDEEVAAVHPAHTQATIRALLPRLRYFQDGTCMVHHMFGGDVCDTVRAYYSDAYQTAHFEVPGEMFRLAMEAKSRDMGVVGSTQNILDYTLDRVQEAIERNQPAGERLRFVLGTETGMVTSIVRAVQAKLRAAKAAGADKIEAEIIFPVSANAVTATGEEQAPAGAAPGALGSLAMVPGPAGGEGCSSEGGCASCPYMKMNTLDALMKVCEKVGTPAQALLVAQEPRKYETAGDGPSIAEQGCLPILHMRHFQQNKVFSDELVKDITTRAA